MNALRPEIKRLNKQRDQIKKFLLDQNYPAEAIEKILESEKWVTLSKNKFAYYGKEKRNTYQSVFICHNWHQIRAQASVIISNTFSYFTLAVELGCSIEIELKYDHISNNVFFFKINPRLGFILDSFISVSRNMKRKIGLWTVTVPKQNDYWWTREMELSSYDLRKMILIRMFCLLCKYTPIL